MKRDMDGVAEMFSDWLKVFRPGIKATIAVGSDEIFVYVEKGSAKSVPTEFSGIKVTTKKTGPIRPARSK